MGMPGFWELIIILFIVFFMVSHFSAIFLGYRELHRKLRKGLSYAEASTAIVGFILYFIPFLWALGLGYRQLWRHLRKSWQKGDA